MRLPIELMNAFQKRGVAIEISNTYHAAALYNLLCSERNGEGIILFTKELKTPRYVFDVSSSMPTGDNVQDRMRKTRAEMEMKARNQMAGKKFQ